MKKLFNRENWEIKLLAILLALILWIYVKFIETGQISLISGMGN